MSNLGLYIPLVPFVFTGCAVLGLSLLDFSKEKRLKKIGVKTTGKVTGTVSAVYKAGSNYGVDMAGYANPAATVSNGGSGPETLSKGGVLLNVEYGDEEYIYTGKTRKSYKPKRIPNEVEVIYDPENPSDAMIDGFYKVGTSKYIRMGVGIGLLVACGIASVFISLNADMLS